MKLRKLLVKPVTRGRKPAVISSCSVLPPEIVCTTMHLMLFSERLPIYACTTISGGRTEQHVIIGFEELAAVD